MYIQRRRENRWDPYNRHCAVRIPHPWVGREYFFNHSTLVMMKLKHWKVITLKWINKIRARGCWSRDTSDAHIPGCTRKHLLLVLFCLVPHQSENGKYNLIPFNLKKIKIIVSACRQGHFRHPHSCVHVEKSTSGYFLN